MALEFTKPNSLEEFISLELLGIMSFMKLSHTLIWGVKLPSEALGST